MRHTRLTAVAAMQMMAASILTEQHPELLTVKQRYQTNEKEPPAPKELTEHDKAMLRRAEEKRQRKASKRVPK